MAQEHTVLVASQKADADIAPNRFVKKTSTGVAYATAGTDKIMGVQNGTQTAKQGRMAPVSLLGTAVIEASAAINVGDYVTATTDGKGVATTTAGNVVRGVALEAATAAGDLIEVMLVFFHHKA